MANDLTIELTSEGRQQLARVIEVFNPQELLQAILKFFEMKAPIAAGFVVKNNLSGQLLKRRTGELARSVVGRAEVVNGVPGIRIGVFRGPASVYAPLQEVGGLVHAVHTANMAIPVGDSLTPSGADKYESPAQYPGKLRFVPFRRGIAVGALYDEKELKFIRHNHLTLANAKAAYILLREAKIPATEFLRSGLRNYLPQLAIELGDYLRSLIDGTTVKTT